MCLLKQRVDRMSNETQYVDARHRYHRENTAGSLIFFESLFVALMIGFRFHSWKVGLLVFIGLFIFCWIPPIAIGLSIVFSLFWAMIGVVIGMGFLQSVLFAVIFAIIAFVISMVLHLEYCRII